MLQHILQPSLKIDDKFATWIVITDSGLVHSGLLVRKNDREVVLKTAERKEIRIATGDIDEMTKSPRSLMPVGILGDLTAQQAADLLEWIGHLEQ